jgi:hypothetical protein
VFFRGRCSREIGLPGVTRSDTGSKRRARMGYEKLIASSF